MTHIEVTYMESYSPLGTQDGYSYGVYPQAMPLPNFREKH
jgi:hypothetical protein